MKFLFALLLVVASVHANSLHRYGWTSGKESVYRFQSQVLNGIPEINNKQLAGLQLESIVRVQSFSDYSLRIKLESPKLVVRNEELSLTESGMIKERPQGGHMSEEFVKHLEQPFLVYMKNGVVQSFKVEQGEPSGVTNIKRSVLSQLQLDVAGTQRSEMESNHIMIPTPMESELSELSEDTHPTYFHTKEESIHGKCKTTYTIQRIPQYKVKEFEEQWAKENKEMRITPDQPTEPEFCKGKPYYQVVKSKNFDECEVAPIFQKWTGVSGKCNLAKPSTCTGLLLSLSSSTYVICGELSQYQIRHIKTENIIKTNPVAFTTEESFHSTTFINLNLLKVKPITERLPLPSQLKEKKSIIYSFPKQSEQQGKISEEVRKLSMEILGVEPVLPQPSLEQAPPTLVPVKLPKEEIKQQVLQQLRKMASEVAQSPESCSSKSDVTGIMLTVTKYLRALPLPLLEQLKSEITQGSSQELKPIEKLFWDTISTVGTNPSTILVVKKIKEGSLPTPFAAKLIQRTIRNVRYPTKELLRELVSLSKHQSVKSHKELLTAVLGNLSDLFYRAYVNPSTMISQFPSQIYGVFGHKDTPVLVEEFIPYLIRIAQGEESVGSNAAKQQLQYTAIASLGRTGHVKVIPTLLKVVEGKLKPVKPEPEESPIEQLEAKVLRPLAIHSMKRVAKMNPPQVKPLLLSIIRNPVEAPEVRTAAVAILPYAQPNPNDIQTIALRTWFEPSRQVANFIRSTLYSLVNTEVPEFQPLAGFVRVTLPIMKPHDFGYVFARNMHFNQFIEYLQTGFVNAVQLEQSKKASFPTRLSQQTIFYGQNGAFKLEGYTLQMYLQGMDRIVEKYVKYFTYAGKTNQHTKQILEQISQKLQLEKRGYKQVELFSASKVFGLHYDYYLDHETVMESLERISEQVNQGEKSYTFNTVSGTVWQEANALVMTDAGFPVVSTLALPMVYSVKGHVKVNGIPDLPQGPKGLPEVEASITPVFNLKLHSTLAVISPCTKEVVGTGVEASVHSSIPLKVQAKIQQGELEVVVKNPSESERNGRETETLHGFILPFTYVKSLLQVKPVTKSQSFKRVVSQTPRKMEMEIGQSLGLSARIYYESNNIYPDFASYIEKIRQTTLSSLPFAAIIPSSVRYSSTKIKYNPRQSETKELVLKLKLWSEEPMMHGLTRPINMEDVEPEFHSVRSVLQKIKSSSGKATLFSFSASTKGQYSGKALKTSWIVGKGSDSETSKTYSALNVKIGQSGTYSIKYEGESSFTSLKNLFKLDELVQEPLQGQFSAKIQYGKSQENQIVVKGQMTKTEKQQQAIRESPEYKKCQEHRQQGIKLSQVCREVRLQAASLDQFEVKVEQYPESLAKSSVVRMIKQLVESYLIGQISYYPESGSSQLQMKVRFERTGQVAQAEVKLPSGELLKIKNIRLLGYPKNLLPLPIHAFLGQSLKQTLSKGYVPYTCSVEPKTITTFDNKTFGYQLNGCEHVLLHDGSKQFPISVLAKTVQSEKKEVRIISGEVEIKLIPQGSSVEVKINGSPVQLPTGQVKYIKSPEGQYVMVELKKYQEGTQWVYLPQQGLEVLSDGERIEVITTGGLLWSRAVGVCGDMNGEATADLKSPKKCVMTPKIGAISYILNKQQSSEPSCPGIPSQYKEQYERETQQCLKEKVIPTPLLKIWEDIRQINLPLVRNHVVDKHVTKTCFSKHMINVCKGEPLEVRNVPLQFVCFPRPSVEASTLEKRALAGEPLYYIFKQMPTVYTKVMPEPVKCKSE